MHKPILVITSVGSEQQALTIAEELIQLEYAASVNIMPTMRSIYRFSGKVYDDEENFLIIKTTNELFDYVAEVICQMHTYEVPEIVGIPCARYQDEFAQWIVESVAAPDPES